MTFQSILSALEAYHKLELPFLLELTFTRRRTVIYSKMQNGNCNEKPHFSTKR